MGIKAMPTVKFRQFLKSLGLVHKRTKGGHEIWDYPNNSLDRPVIIRTSKKEIPRTNIHTNLITLGISHTEFEKIIKNL